MSRHREVRQILAGVITGIVGVGNAKVLGPDELDGNEQTWPARLVTSAGRVHGYVIRWSAGNQVESPTPKPADKQKTFEIKAYHSKLDQETNDTFYDHLEEIEDELKPHRRFPLPDGAHVQIVSFRWEHKEKSPQPDKVLLYSIGTLAVKFRGDC